MKIYYAPGTRAARVVRLFDYPPYLQWFHYCEGTMIAAHQHHRRANSVTSGTTTQRRRPGDCAKAGGEGAGAD